MAHLVDGVLAMPVVVAGAAVAVGAVAYGLRQVDGERVPYVVCPVMMGGIVRLEEVPVAIYDG